MMRQSSRPTHTAALVLALLVLGGCAAGKKTQKPPAIEEPEKAVSNFDAMNESFDPTTLEDEDIVIEQAPEAATSLDDLLSPEGQASEDSMVTGYRVQLVQTTDPEEAREVQREAILKFNEEVYRTFDPPFYKVRVGDFVNWYDAEKLQKLAIERGFKEAWVIRTKVHLARAAQWMEEF